MGEPPAQNYKELQQPSGRNQPHMPVEALLVTQISGYGNTICPEDFCQLRRRF
jgi:hypothetical protein